MPLRLSACVILLFATLLLFGGCASVNRLATTAGSPLHWNGHSRIELPLTLDSVGRPTVPGRIMGHDATVLIDSGGGWPSMTRTLAAATGALSTSSAMVNGAAYAAVAGVAVQLGNASIDLRKVAIGEQTAEAQFVLGPELFLQAIVDMDFDTGRMTLINPAAWIPPAAAPVPVQLWWTKPTVQLQVNGHVQPVCAVLDTGFNAGVALSGEVVHQLALPRIAGETTLTGYGGKSWNAARLAPLQEVGFSAQRYSDVPLTEKKSDVEWECPNLVGMALLSRHRVIFDLRQQRVWLLPRAGSLPSG